MDDGIRMFKTLTRPTGISADEALRWKHKIKSKFKVGQMVLHRQRKILGKIVAEWGTWTSCKNCYQELDRKAETCHCCGQPTKMAWRRGLTIKNTVVISGQGIYEVIFQGERVRSQCSQDVLLQPEEKNKNE